MDGITDTISWFPQKYRSHRKHLLAREAEAASWSQRRQQAAAYGTAGTAGLGCKRDVVHPWVGVAAPVPSLGFPTPSPPPPPPPPAIHQHFRPLHVWGHPTVDVWPKHVVHSPPPWAMPPSSLQPDPKFWNNRCAAVSILSSLPPHTSFFMNKHRSEPVFLVLDGLKRAIADETCRLQRTGGLMVLLLQGRPSSPRRCSRYCPPTFIPFYCLIDICVLVSLTSIDLDQCVCPLVSIYHERGEYISWRL